MTDASKELDSILHDGPCLLSVPGNWRLDDGTWRPRFDCTCLVTATGGWVTPAEQLFPTVTARRGGIQFGDGLDQLTQEELITRVRALTGHLKRAEKRARKAERKNRRLLALVDKLV